MNFLVTGTRQPFALDEIRKLGRMGHRVTTLDAFSTAPGSHSRYAQRRILTVSPRFELAGFLADLKRAIREEGIDVLLPTFEEAFYIAAHHEELSQLTTVFSSPLPVLARLHHKGAFAQLAVDLGLPTPRSEVVADRDALRAATAARERYVARPVFSRGGTQVLTNAGPMKGLLALDACSPTTEKPWLVQDFVGRHEVCTFSVVQHGRVCAHSAYVHPLDIGGSGGIVFESTEPLGTLWVAERVARALDYHGQISFDLRRGDDGELVVIECNPRPTAGVYAMSDEMFTRAVLEPPPATPALAPAGVRHMISAAVVRDLLKDWRHVATDLRYLLSPEVKDVFAAEDDLAPALYQLLTVSHVREYQRWAGPNRDRRKDLVNAYCYDLAWDGEPIP